MINRYLLLNEYVSVGVLRICLNLNEASEHTRTRTLTPIPENKKI